MRISKTHDIKIRIIVKDQNFQIKTNIANEISNEREKLNENHIIELHTQTN